jgi:ribosome-binding ATPase YchF (GTP1/OBG family)
MVALCARLEADLAEMEPQEAQEFREALGASQTSLDTVIQRSFELLGLITFYTHASNEVKAWTIRRGLAAPQAAGNVHTDMERGFIRAEVVAYDELARLGSLAESRHHGVLRAEGRHYVVQDGDVITFLFNV